MRFFQPKTILLGDYAIVKKRIDRLMLKIDMLRRTDCGLCLQIIRDWLRSLRKSRSFVKSAETKVNEVVEAEKKSFLRGVVVSLTAKPQYLTSHNTQPARRNQLEEIS
ncbi:MAG: hypothetical protein AAFZ17_04850 [Cyanobacteria bacterium J06650_10]